MYRKAVLLSVVAVALTLAQEPDIRNPPKIKEPNSAKTLYHVENSEFTVSCQADGNPTPMYMWRKGEQSITPSQYVSYDSTSGELSFKRFNQLQEGEYMCLATNNFENDQGSQVSVTAFSPPIKLVQTRVVTFIPRDPVTVTAEEYTYVRLNCSNKGENAGDDLAYNWYENTRTAQLSLDGGRIYVDDDGNLHFSYVKKEDDKNVKYVCGISSPSAKVIILGNSNNLQVNKVLSPSVVKPQIQYTHASQGLRFGSAQMECVFSGYDPQPPHIPSMQWFDDAGTEIVARPDKYILSADRRKLTVLKLEEVDEKNYYCQAENSGGRTDQVSVFLDVTSAPIFRKAPIDERSPENKDVTFYCDARSAINEPAPKPPVWYINGVMTGSHTDTSKIKISNDQKQLTVVSVKKATDIMCVQCKVTNHVGTTWGNGCLNVWLPISITRQPALRQEIDHGDVVDLTVAATTDPAATLGYRWEFKNATYETDQLPFLTIDPFTLAMHINTSELTEDEYESVGGVYNRVIYNEEETIKVAIEVVLKDKPIIVPIVTSKAGFDMWIIGLIIGIIFLIIVIIIIICIICRKKQEGDYNVDKKEHGAGLDPEKELLDKGFNDYSRPDHDDYDYDKKPRGELEYDDVHPDGDNTSLGEYGEEDAANFNEDGSFIGVYQNKKPLGQKGAGLNSESTI